MSIDDVNHAASFVTFGSVDTGKSNGAIYEEGIGIGVDSGKMRVDSHFPQAFTDPADFLARGKRIGIDDNDVVISQFIIPQVLPDLVDQPFSLIFFTIEDLESDQIVDIRMLLKE